MLHAKPKPKLAVRCGLLGLILFFRFDPVGAGNACLAAQKDSVNRRPVRIVGPYLAREDVGPYTRVVLKNGLTVVLFERSNTPLVAMVTYVKVGRLHESKSQKGFSKLWPRLMFHSRVPGREGTVSREARKWGAVIDAGVNQDHAWFSAVLSPEEYRRGLELQVAALHSLNPSSVTLERVNRTVRRQFALDRADPGNFSRRRLFELAFQGERRFAEETEIGGGWAIADAARIEEFHSQWFVPGNTFLTVTGNFDRRALLREIVKRYQSIPQRPVPALPNDPQPTTDGFKYANRQGDVQQTWVQIGFPLPAAFNKDWYACKVLEALLTKGDTAVLNRHLRNIGAAVHSISSSTMALGGLSYLNLTLSLDGKDLDRAAAITFAGIERVKQGGLIESDLRRARAWLEAEFHQRQEALVDLAIQLTRYEHLSDHDTWRKYLQRIRSVTRQEVIAAARRYLNLEQCSFLEYQPASDEKRTFNPASYREFLRLALPRSVRELSRDTEVGISLPEEAGQQEIQPPGQKDPKEISTLGLAPPMKKFSILRGPDVWVKEERWLPLTAMGIFFSGGRLYEGPENDGITALMAATAIQGGRNASAAHPNRFFESLGVAVKVVVEPDFFGFVLHGLSRNFGSCVDVLVETLQRPGFEEEAILAQRMALRLEAAELLDDPRRQVERLFLQAAYPGHPYGKAADGALEALEGITRQELVEWHRRYVRGSRPVVVTAGDVEGSAFAARFASKWSRPGISRFDFDAVGDVRRLTAPRYKRGESRRNQQWHAQAGFLGPEASDPRLTAFTVLQHLTSGAGGSLTLALQDLEGLVSPIITSHRRRERGGLFYAYLSADPAHGQQALDELKAHLTRLAVKPLPKEEIDQAKTIASLTYRIAMQRRTQQVLELAEQAVFGRSVYEVNNHLKKIEALDSAVVSEVTREFFKPELWIAGVLSGPIPEASPPQPASEQ